MAKSEKNKGVEDKIFGAKASAPKPAPSTPPTEPTEPAGAVVATPPATQKNDMGKQTITLGKEQFDAIMARLGDLESGAMAREPKGADDVFNPLAEVKQDHEVRLCYHGDLLVVGYKGKVRPDGRTVFTFMRYDEATKETRTAVTLLLVDPKTKETSEETVDMIAFLENAVVLPATIKERKDIGRIVEHGIVRQRIWDGKGLTETGKKVMSGCREQKFQYRVEHNGDIYDLPQEAVNIK